MGKATGFLEYERVENPGQEPLERIKTYREFHTPLNLEERQKQGARCMDCGVPFCQNGKPIMGMVSGCPLNNLCPEWNELVYKGRMEDAARRLLLTNCFPEFTSRVCPALCEKACTCGLYGDPVTVKENEYAIIESAYESGFMKPRIPKVRTGKKVAVIGSGPSGLAAALQLNRRGHSVTVYEREDRVGGLLMYGIPNMKLEKTVIDRRIALMEQEGVVFRTGVDVGKDISAEEIQKQYDAVVLACGSSNPRNINAPGRESKGIYYAVEFLKATTKSLINSNLSDGYYQCKVQECHRHRRRRYRKRLRRNGNSARLQICHSAGNDAETAGSACREQPLAGVAENLQDRLRSGRSHCSIRTRPENLSDNGKTIHSECRRTSESR